MSDAAGVSGNGAVGTGSTIGLVGESSTGWKAGGAAATGGANGAGAGSAAAAKAGVTGAAGGATGAGGGGGVDGAGRGSGEDEGAGAMAVSRVGTNGNGSSEATPPESSPGWNSRDVISNASLSSAAAALVGREEERRRLLSVSWNFGAGGGSAGAFFTCRVGVGGLGSTCDSSSAIAPSTLRSPESAR